MSAPPTSLRDEVAMMIRAARLGDPTPLDWPRERPLPEAYAAADAVLGVVRERIRDTATPMMQTRDDLDALNRYRRDVLALLGAER